jgi:hypothetical protein
VCKLLSEVVKKIKTRNGVSLLVTTFLLISTSIAASGLTYSWVISMVESQSNQTRTWIRIENVSWKLNYSGGDDRVEIKIRNTGSIAATIESISIRENKVGSTTFTDNYFIPTDSNNSVGSVEIGESITLYLDTAHPEINQLGINTGWQADPGENTIVNNKSYLVRVNTTTVFFYEAVAISSP